MIDKCVNPGCTTPFRYLRGGKLFLFSQAAPASDLSTLGSMTNAARTSEFFWLCEHCCQIMSVTIAKSGEIVLIAGGERKAILRGTPLQAEEKTQAAPLEPSIA